MTKLEELSVEHSYYCETMNYFSNEAGLHFENMSDFLFEFEDADIDMNLCFRWDIKRNTDEETDKPIDGYRAEVFIMGQRKGWFKPCVIDSVNENEAIRFERYAAKHWEYLKNLWSPISNIKEDTNEKNNL